MNQVPSEGLHVLEAVFSHVAGPTLREVKTRTS